MFGSVGGGCSPRTTSLGAAEHHASDDDQVHDGDPQFRGRAKPWRNETLGILARREIATVRASNRLAQSLARGVVKLGSKRSYAGHPSRA